MKTSISVTPVSSNQYAREHIALTLTVRTLTLLAALVLPLGGFARAEKQGGDLAGQAKEKVEQLYKALHNNTLIGIEKVYRKANEEPAQ